MRWFLFAGITLLAAGCDQTQDPGGSFGQPCPEDSGPCSPGDAGGGMGGSGGGGVGGSGGGGVGGSGGGGVSIASWSKSFGDVGVDIAGTTAVDSAGNVVVTGSFPWTVDFGGGPLTSEGGSDDIFLAKFDSSGNHLWSKHFGDLTTQRANATAVDSAGNVVVTGFFYGTVYFGGSSGLTSASANDSDIFVAKFDSSGNHLWSKRFGDAGAQSAHAMAVDSAGNVVVIGEFRDTVDFGGGPLTSAGGSDGFVAKLDANGNHIWSKRFGDAFNQQIAYATAVDSAGNVAITGYMAGTVDFGGGPLTSAGELDIFVAKFDPNGNHVWSERFGDENDQFALAMAVDSAGNVAITGSTEGTVDFGGGPLTSAGKLDIFVAKLDPSGNHVLSKRFGDASSQSAKAMAIDSAGNMVITGQFSSLIDFGGGPLTSAGSEDIFVARLDPSGDHLWSTRFGDASYQTAKATAIDSAGDVVVTGFFEGTVDFGNGPYVSAGHADVFLVKLTP